MVFLVADWQPFLCVLDSIKRTDSLELTNILITLHINNLAKQVNHILMKKSGYFPEVTSKKKV